MVRALASMQNHSRSLPILFLTFSLLGLLMPVSSFCGDEPFVLPGHQDLKSIIFSNIFSNEGSGSSPVYLENTKRLIEKAQQHHGATHPVVVDLVLRIAHLLLDEAALRSAEKEELQKQALDLHWYAYSLRITAADFKGARDVLLSISKNSIWGRAVFDEQTLLFQMPILGVVSSQLEPKDDEIMARGVLLLFAAKTFSEESLWRDLKTRARNFYYSLLAKHPSRFLMLDVQKQIWILESLKSILSQTYGPDGVEIAHELQRAIDQQKRRSQGFSSAMMAELLVSLGDFETRFHHTFYARQFYLSALHYLTPHSESLAERPGEKQDLSSALPASASTHHIWQKIVAPFFEERDLIRHSVPFGYSYDFAEARIMTHVAARSFLEGLLSSQQQVYGLNHGVLVRTLFERAWVDRQDLKTSLRSLAEAGGISDVANVARLSGSDFATSEQENLRSALEIIKTGDAAKNSSNVVVRTPTEYEVTLVLADAISFGALLAVNHDDQKLPALNEARSLFEKAFQLSQVKKNFDLPLCLDHLQMALNLWQRHGSAFPNYFDQWKQFMDNLKPLVAQVQGVLLGLTELEILAGARGQGGHEPHLNLKRRRFQIFCQEVARLLRGRGYNDAALYYENQRAELQKAIDRGPSPYEDDRRSVCETPLKKVKPKSMN